MANNHDNLGNDLLVLSGVFILGAILGAAIGLTLKLM